MLESIYKLTSSNNHVHCIGSYDGAYQSRSGKSGGGLRRYCFASTISVDPCKVRSYDIACNSCSSWNENEPKYTKGQISEANIKHGHKIIKQSVQLNILNLHLSN